MTKFSIILLAITLIALGLSGLGAPMGLVVPVLALITGIVLLLQALGVTHPRPPQP